jgi:hypothetical protein
MSGRDERRRMMGAQTFSMPTTTCPPGQHWEDDSAGPIRGLAACVPNRTIALRLVPAAAAPAAVPATTVAVQFPGLTMPTTAAAPAPTSLDRAPPLEACPPVWPWWWLVLAAAAGGAAGYYAGQNPKKTKKNAGRVAHAIGGRIVNRAGHAAMSRLF